MEWNRELANESRPYEHMQSAQLMQSHVNFGACAGILYVLRRTGLILQKEN